MAMKMEPHNGCHFNVIKRMKTIDYLNLSCFLLIGLTNAARADEQMFLLLARRFEVIAPRITEEYRQYDTNKNYQHLVQADTLLSSITRIDGMGTSQVVTISTSVKNDSEVLSKIFNLRLSLYDRCLGARDATFNIRDEASRAAINVMPPFVDGENVVAGMNPADIKNPEARKKYQQDILENHRKEEKFKQEYTLQKMEEKLKREITGYLSTIRRSGDSAIKKQAIDDISKRITQPNAQFTLLKLLEATETPK